MTQRVCLLSSSAQHTIIVLLPNNVVDGTVSDDTLRWNSVHPHDTDQWKSTEDQREKKELQKMKTRLAVPHTSEASVYRSFWVMYKSKGNLGMKEKSGTST